MKISEIPPEEQAEKVRQYNREAKRRQRDREHLEKLSKIDQHNKQVVRSQRRKRNLVCFGEIDFGRNARTAEEEIFVHRLFLRDLGQPDVQQGETLRQLATRCYEAWITKYGNDREYAPAFSLTTYKFDDDYGFQISKQPFEEIWMAPKGGGETPIDVANLPALPVIAKLETTPVVLAPVVMSDTDAAAERRILEQKKAQSREFGLPVDALRFLEQGR
jgi:hypothetical protein